MSKPLATIESWEVVHTDISGSFEELRPGNRLTGYVFGHAKFPNAKRVRTSPIVSIDLTQGVVETLNTMYLLGETSDDYKVWEQERVHAWLYIPHDEAPKEHE